MLVCLGKQGKAEETLRRELEASFSSFPFEFYCAVTLTFYFINNTNELR